MANKYDNAKQNKIGKVGEKVVTELLSKHLNITRIEDVSNSKQYQHEDVDLLVYLDVDGKQKIRKVEVKTDERAGSTGNFFVEKQIRYTKDVYNEDGSLRYAKGQIRQGWLFASQADVFFWYVEGHKKVYACKKSTLEKYIKDYPPKTRPRDDGYKIVEGYLVSIEKLCKKYDVLVLDVE